MIGKTLAHYEITAFLGEGGMGAVYRAHDGKLGRDVALKILPAEFAQNPERLARFQREARTLASLSHPHIASIYGLEEAEDQRFLVMELIEGEDLSERMKRGPIPLDESLAIAVQIAEALESAHESGVIHRDLKPANVKLAPDGQIKLLDFGLARAASGTPEDGEDPANSPTITAAFTAAGTILGTAAYMSPEQARGRHVDRRADIWAFGAVLFEMLSGGKLFAGETVSDTLASVIKEEPNWNLLPADTPPVIVAVIRRCLQKDLKRRLQSIGEARIAIQELLQGGDAASASATLLSSGSARVLDVAEVPTRRVPMLAWLIALVAVASLAFVIGMRVSSSEESPRLRKFLLQPEHLNVTYPQQPALSPDGRRVAYFADTMLRIRDLQSLDSIEVPGSDGATSPFWSPDGQWLGFGLRGQVYKMPATGGRLESICETTFTTLDGACWGEDGRIYMAPDSGPMQVVSDGGGDPVVLFPLSESESDYHTPSLLPGDRGLLFTTHDGSGRETIELFDGSSRKVLLKIPGARLEYAQWSGLAGSKTRGHIVYHRLNANEGVWAMPFDLESLELTGDPFLIDSDGAYPSVGRDGSLLFSNSSGMGPHRFVLVDRKGTVVQRIGDANEGLAGFAISPDGKSILVQSDESGNADIWRYDMVRGSRTRVSFSSERESQPGWLGDGQRIHFVRSNTGIEPNTYVRPASGVGEATTLLNGYQAHSVPGSDQIVFARFNPGTTNDLYYTSLESEEEPKLLLQTPASETGPQLSPDGRFVTFMSNESGRNAVYLVTFPEATGKWQVSGDGGAWPKWSSSGDEIIYRSGAGATASMMSVSVQTEPDVVLGPPVVLFTSQDEPNLLYSSGYGAYEPVPDSDLILMYEHADFGAAQNLRLVFIEDWYASYRDRVHAR